MLVRCVFLLACTLESLTPFLFTNSHCIVFLSLQLCGGLCNHLVSLFSTSSWSTLDGQPCCCSAKNIPCWLESSWIFQWLEEWTLASHLTPLLKLDLRMRVYGQAWKMRANDHQCLETTALLAWVVVFSLECTSFPPSWHQVRHSPDHGSSITRSITWLQWVLDGFFDPVSNK